MSNSSIWSIDDTQSDASTPGQSVPGSGGNEEVLRIPQSSCITGASPSELFSVISKTLFGECLTCLQKAVLADCTIFMGKQLTII